MGDSQNHSAHMAELWKTGRPQTGLYGLLLSFVGFKFFDWQDWQLGLGLGVLYVFMSMSIMRCNDVVDAENDRRKHKHFAFLNRKLLLYVWLVEGALIIVGLALVGQYDMLLAAFCATFWIVGLLYSLIPHWFITQNIVVAICSGSPVFCASVHFRTYEPVAAATAFLFFVIMWQSEIHKDVEDWWTDQGYKDTLPTRLGVTQTMLILVASLHLMATAFYWHPVLLMQVIAFTLIPWLAYQQAQVLLKHNYIHNVMATVNKVIIAVGVVLYIT